MQQVDVRFLEVGFRLQFRVPPMTVDSSAFVDKGSIVKRTVLQSLIQSMQQNYVVEVVRDRVLLSPLPCPEEVRKDGDQSSTSHFSISSTDSLIPAQQGGYAHTWQIKLGLFASTEKMVPLGWLHTVKLYIASQHWDFNALTSNLWIPLFPTAEEDGPMVDVSTQCS